MNRKIVIKIGSNLLVGGRARVDTGLIEWLADGLKFLASKKISAAVVTSGAIGAGKSLRSISRGGSKLSIREKQALAACGQPVLMRHYHDVFASRGLTPAQILLTRDDLASRDRFINIRSTILTLMEMSVVPVINENDTVAVDEIKFGDNDELSAIVAAKIGASLLAILTDVDGLYRGAFVRENLVRVVQKITPDVEKLAISGAGSDYGTGGMVSKLRAAKIAAAAGVETILAKPTPGFFAALAEGKTDGTLFCAGERLKSRKCWIAFGASARGTVGVDAGAAEALSKRGRSLLASGVVSVEGEFSAGDAVIIRDAAAGREIGRGLARFSSSELLKIKGRHSREISRILPGDTRAEVIHRDDMALENGEN